MQFHYCGGLLAGTIPGSPGGPGHVDDIHLRCLRHRFDEQHCAIGGTVPVASALRLHDILHHTDLCRGVRGGLAYVCHKYRLFGEYVSCCPDRHRMYCAAVELLWIRLHAAQAVYPGGDGRREYRRFPGVFQSGRYQIAD